MPQNRPEHETDEQETDDTPEESSEQSEEEQLSLDVTFEVLKNARRRRVLHHLQNEETSTTLGDLAERLAAIENGKERSQLDSQERKRVYVGLYQCHLPKMDDTDVIEFDADRGTVELGPNADDVYQYLATDAGDEERHPWPRYYAAYSLVGVAFAAALFVATTPPLQTIGFGIVLAGLLLLSGAHYSSERTDG